MGLFLLSTFFLVPAASPEDITIQLFNSTSAVLMWGPPNGRDLNGDLRGYKVIIEFANNSASQQNTESTNFTLDAEVTSLQLDNLTTQVSQSN